MCKVAKTFKLLISLPIVFLVFVSCSVDNSVGYRNIVSILGGVWEFEVEDNYTFDGNQIEIVDGKAKLKQVDQTHSGNDFELGTHVGTYFNTSSLLSILYKQEDLSLLQLIPSKGESLIGYWRMDGDLKDQSPAGLDLQNSSGASLDNDNILGTNSIDFNGSDQFVSTAPIAYVGDNLTISLWVKFKSLPDNLDTLIEYGYDGSNIPFFIDVRGGNICAGSYVLGVITGNIICSSSVVSDYLNEWIHVSFVKEKERFKIFLNGVLETSESKINTTNLQNDNGVFLGAHNGGGNAPARFSDIRLDEVAVYRAALSDAEIVNIYNFQKLTFSSLAPAWIPQWDHLIGYWKMDGNWQDSSGNENHGTTVLGNPTFSTSAKVGSHAGDFDGTGDYIQISNSASLNPTRLTISAWIKTTDPAEEYILNKHNDSFYFAKGAVSGKLCMYINVVASSWNCSSQSISDGQWHHVATTYDGVQTQLYIDGKPDGIFAGVGGDIPNAGTNDMYIGHREASPADQLWTGLLDDASMWNVALSRGEILKIYNRQKQKYAGHYDSPVIDLGAASNWTNLSVITTLPFDKEISSQTSEGSSAYSSLVGSLGANLIAAWGFNELTTGTAPGGGDYSDSGPAGYHATQSGGVVSGRPAVNVNGLQLDGSDDYVAIPTLSEGSMVDYAVSIWLNVSDTNHARQYLVDFRGDGSTDSRSIAVFIDRTTPGSFQFKCFSQFSTNANFSQYRVDEIYETGKWYHVVCNRSGSTIEAYINGELKPVSFEAGVPLTGDPFLLDFPGRIGAYSGGGVGNYWLSGWIDQVAIWSETLEQSKIQQLYRRSANRVKYQLKSCVDSSCNCKEFAGVNPTSNDCDGDGILNSVDPDSGETLAEFMGPGGDEVTSYSELYNRQVDDISFSCNTNATDSNPDVCVADEIAFSGHPRTTSPRFTFSNFPASARPANNRYFQYRVLMEAEENSACGGEPCLPELTSIEVGPTGRYFSGTPSIVNKTNHPIDKALENLSVSASSGCDLSYQISNDGTTFYYWDGSSWVVGSSNSQAVSLDTLNDNIKSFTEQIGLGDFYFRSYLGNSSFGECEVDKIQIIKARR